MEFFAKVLMILMEIFMVLLILCAILFITCCICYILKLNLPCVINLEKLLEKFDKKCREDQILRGRD